MCYTYDMQTANTRRRKSGPRSSVSISIRRDTYIGLVQMTKTGLRGRQPSSVAQAVSWLVQDAIQAESASNTLPGTCDHPCGVLAST